MLAVKGKVINGSIQLLEKVDYSEDEEVLVIFKNAMQNKDKREGLSGNELNQLIGIIEVGGDAFEDSEAIYD